VRDPDFSTFQAPSPATHFRHPQVALPRSFLGSFPSFFDEVCSNRTIIDLIIDPNEVNGPLGDALAAAIFQAWVDKLDKLEQELEWTEDRSSTPGFSTFGTFSHSVLFSLPCSPSRF
jgi:hypothetical protein